MPESGEVDLDRVREAIDSELEREGGNLLRAIALTTALLATTIMLGLGLALLSVVDIQASQSSTRRTRDRAFNLSESDLNTHPFFLRHNRATAVPPTPRRPPGTGPTDHPGSARTGPDARGRLLHRAASPADAGEPFTRAASMGKLYATEAASRAANASLQVLGGYGYLRDHPVERIVRDARLMEIGEGTSEIQRIVIARDLVLAS